MIQVILAALLAAFPLSQQSLASDKSAVLAAADAWLAAFNAGDKAKLASLTHPDGTQFSILYLPGQEGVRVRSNREDMANGKPGGPRFTERMWRPTVLLRGDLAQIWAPYSFDIDGKRSHCGIDNFTFVRIGGRWTLANASWTVEPPANSCGELGEAK